MWLIGNTRLGTHDFCMNEIVKTLRFTGVFRIFFALAFVATFWAHNGFAATVRYEVLPDRERVTVALHHEEGFAGEVTRVDPRGLLLNLGVPTDGMGRDLAPENAKFFSMSEPRGRAIGFFMKTAAFGFVVTRPDRNTVIINAYADPLGERWTPEGLAPAPAAKQEDGAPGDAATASSPIAPESTPESPAATEKPGVLRGKIAADVPSGEPASPPEPPAHAVRPATPPPAQSAQAASKSVPTSAEGTVFRSRLNHGGPAAWEAMYAERQAAHGVAPEASAVAASEPKTTEPATEAVAEEISPPRSSEAEARAETPPPPGATPETPIPEKIYVDADGNPVPPPPDPVTTLAEVRKDVSSRNFKDALEKITPLLTHPELTGEQTEEVLHLHAEVLFMANQGALAENFDAITSATITAMNYNQESPRNAAAYLRLGYINLQVGNTVEAEAYFVRLRRQYPLDENIPLTYYYWGNHYYDKGEMQKAADEFQYIISNFSENKISREASLGLARCYNELGYYKEAFDIVDYMERRWPRLYLESPPVLELMGDIAFRRGKLDFALDRYSIYYNLMPNGPKADVILSRIGDVYALKRQMAAAKVAYQEAERLFPDRDGGLVAMMRLAEVGINDLPEIQNMFSVFQGPANLKTVEIYTKIITEYTQSDLVPLARLKLAMWYYVNKRYEEALNACTELTGLYPKHELVPYAEEVAMKAFAALAAEGATQNRPAQVITNWRDNPILRKQEESLSSESRVALASSMEKQDNPGDALRLLEPMFLGRKDPVYAEQALHLALAIYLEHDMWREVEKLNDRIALWELTSESKNSLEYAVALAREHLDKSEEAAPLWSHLAHSGVLSEEQQAQAEYFLAMDAKDNNRLQEAYLLARSSLNRFLQLAQDNPQKTADGRISSLRNTLMGVCEIAGRFDEALGYANDYLTALPKRAPQRASILTSMARVHQKSGNIPEWRKLLTEVRDTYPDSVYGKTAASALSSEKIANDAAQFSPTGQL